MRRNRPGGGWFAFGVRLFAVALPLGLLVALLAPVEFMEWLGAFALVGSVVGLAVSLAGLRLVSPDRWRQLRSSPLARRAVAVAPRVPR